MALGRIVRLATPSSSLERRDRNIKAAVVVLVTKKNRRTIKPTVGNRVERVWAERVHNYE